MKCYGIGAALLAILLSSGAHAQSTNYTTLPLTALQALGIANAAVPLAGGTMTGNLVAPQFQMPDGNGGVFAFAAGSSNGVTLQGSKTAANLAVQGLVSGSQFQLSDGNGGVFAFAAGSSSGVTLQGSKEAANLSVQGTVTAGSITSAGDIGIQGDNAIDFTPGPNTRRLFWSPYIGTSGGLAYQLGNGSVLLSLDESGNEAIPGKMTAGAASIGGHFASTGTAPTLSSGATFSSGTSPTDVRGTVIEASGQTGFTLTFATAYSPAPVCVISSPTGSAVSSYSTTTTTLQIVTATASGNLQFSYDCTQ